MNIVSHFGVSMFCMYFIVSYSHANWNMELTSGIVKAVANYFSAGCISLIYSQDWNNDLIEAWQLVSMRKRLANVHMSVSTTLIERSIHSHDSCRSCPSLQVILPPSTRHLKNILLPAQIASPGPVWLFFLGNASMEEIADLYVPINCIVVTAFLNREVIELVEVYQPTHHFPLQRNTIFVGKSSDLLPSRLNVAMERKNYIRDMSGFGLKVSVIHNPPLSILTYGENTLNVTGFLPEVWEIVEKIINFTTLYIPVRDKVFGVVLGNGSWTGMVGALLRNETDAALGLTATLQRSYVVDFCIPILFTSYRVYIRDYGNVTASWQNFMLPFTRSLWIGILVCFLISSMILSVSEYLHKMNETVKSSFPLVMNESLFGIFAVFFCQQANIPESKYATSRIVVFSMFLASIILFGAYSGALVSHLTVKRSRNSFTSIHDLIEEGSYTTAVISSSAMLSQFTNESFFSKQKLRSEEFPHDYTAGFHRVCKKKLAFIAPHVITHIYTRNAECKVLHLPHHYTSANMGATLRKRSPYLNLVNHILVKLHSVGILKRLRNKYWNTNFLDEKVSFSTFHLKQFLCPILIFLGGIILSFLLLLIEICVHKNNNKNCRDELLYYRHINIYNSVSCK